MWLQPPIEKIYEALGAVADGRLEVEGNTARCFSSSGNKYYDITFNPELNAIICNDNASYWKGYLGYPAIAFLLYKDILPYQSSYGMLLKGIPWKDINQRFNNDFKKAIDFIFNDFDFDTQNRLKEYAQQLLLDIDNLKMKQLGERIKPPVGY